MNCIRKITLLLFTALFLSPMFMLGQSAYVRKFVPVADSLAAIYNVPAALFLGVAVIESGSGKSRNAKMLNNHFGIIGKNSMHKKGKKSRYKQYHCATDSYVDFANHLTKRKFYKHLKGKMNYVLWVDAMSKDNYSEMPKIWKQRVLSTIKTNNITRLQ